MGKKKSFKGKGTYAAYKAEDRRKKNRLSRIERHMKRHPNDKQTLLSATKALEPKTPSRNKGNYPPERVVYRDASGKEVGSPYFMPDKQDRYHTMCGIKFNAED